MSGLVQWLRSALNENPFKDDFAADRMRPPGAVEEERFMELCIRCARCIEVCPYSSIQRSSYYDRLQIGTPYVYAQQRGCYLCMLCPPVCPTGALDPHVIRPLQVRMGIARINEKTCLNYIYEQDELQGVSRDGSAMICNVCFNVCPLRDTAIILKNGLLPVITDECVGCGACVEKCPTRPKSMQIITEGMVDDLRSGMYHLRSRRTSPDTSHGPADGIYHREELLQRKQELSPQGQKPTFEYNFQVQESVEGWE